MTLRRRFLRVGLQFQREAIRPPWSWDEADFLDSCTHCDACADACPPGIIVKDGNGFPEVDFSVGACSFCGACADACAVRALVRAHGGSTPWLLKATITQSCLAANQVACECCKDICNAGAVRFRPSLGGVPVPKIDTWQCSGCGACVAPCPAGAVAMRNEALH